MTTQTWFPLLTFVLGYIGRSLSEWIQERRLIRREQHARSASRKEHLEERRSNFQRENLLNLQEALFRLARGAGGAHHHDLMVAKRTGKWQKQLLPKDLDEMLTDAQARTAMFMVRTQDAGLREQVQQLKKLEVDITMARSRSDSEEAMASMGKLFIECNFRIGELLRRLDDEVLAGVESRTAGTKR